MFEDIVRNLREQSVELNAALNQFQFVPREGGAYPERSISHFYIRALMDAINGRAVLEPSFPNDRTQKNDHHLDAIVFNDDVAILAEFKTAWAPTHWESLAQDVNRVRVRFAPQINERFKGAKVGMPRRLFGFYGVDAWRFEIARCWESGVPYRSWNIPTQFTSMMRGIQVVSQNESKGKDYDDGYYLLFAFEELFPDQFPATTQSGSFPLTPG